MKSNAATRIALTFTILACCSCGLHSQAGEKTRAKKQPRWAPVITKSGVTLRPIGRDLKVLESEHPLLSEANKRIDDFPKVGDCSNAGVVILDSYDWDYEPYLATLSKKIRSEIYPPRKFTRLGAIEGKSLRQFTILPGGELADLKLVSYEGHPLLAETSLLAVEFAAPLPPLPADFKKKHDQLQVAAIFCFRRRVISPAH